MLSLRAEAHQDGDHHQLPGAWDKTVTRLRTLGGSISAASTPSEFGAHAHPHLIHYTCKTRQSLSSVTFTTPWIVLVLQGHKRLESQSGLLARVGEMILVPTHAPISVTNVPDPRSGTYQALLVEVTSDARARFERHHPDLTGPLSGWFEREALVVAPDPPSLQAFEHVCETLLAPTSHPRVLHHRLEGLLLALLVQTQTLPAAVAPAQARTDLVLAIRNLIRAEPEAAWSAEVVARRLGMSAVSMRRKLAVVGTNLRRLISGERMLLARVLLSDGRLNVGEVALRCGYESTTKFSRQFARAFGRLPSTMRAAG